MNALIKAVSDILDNSLVFFVTAAAKEKGMPDGSYTVMKLELGSLQSVRDFVSNLKAFKSARPLNHLICNAAVYRPTDPEPAWTDDGFEMSMVRELVKYADLPREINGTYFDTFLFHRGSTTLDTFFSSIFFSTT